MIYRSLMQKFAKQFMNNGIRPDDMNFMKENIYHENIILLLKDILSQEELVEKIAARSYTHALGFDKLVLMDFSKDLENTQLINEWGVSQEALSKMQRKTQLRLHIWSAHAEHLPIVESLHEHSFDFISYIITGHLENQRFTFEQLSEKEKHLLTKLKEVLKNLSQDEKLYFNNQLEIIEAIKLKTLGSAQLMNGEMLKELKLDNLQSMVRTLSKEDIWQLSALEGHYVSDRVSGEKKAYKHILKDYVSIKPKDVLQLGSGEYYHHPYELPHRLYYDNRVLNSTILLTTPVATNPDGGSLQRPTYVENSEQNYNKISFSTESFRKTLESFLRYLEK